MNSPRVGIIILSWNAPTQVRQLLRDLEKVTYSNFSVLVLDNGSTTENLKQLKEGWPASVTLIEEPSNLGFAGGVNQALRVLEDQGGFDYYLLLNDDTQPEPEFLSLLVNTMECDKHLAITGPLIRAGSDSPTGLIAEGQISLWTGQTPYSFTEPALEVSPCSLVQGCCFLIRATALRRIGLLEEAYFAYYEESDFCLRAARAGFGLAVVKAARIFHEGGASMRKVSRLKEYLMIRNRLWLVRKNGNAAQFLVASLIMLLFHLPKRIRRLVLDRQFDLLKVLPQAFWDGLTGSDSRARYLTVNLKAN